jgi:ferric-dicitrate binding protein FerR (iron transport regulator)
VPETHEERLRTAFRDAAAAGQRAAVPAPASAVRARGDRRRRQRLALLCAAACAVLGGTTASVIALLPTGDGGPTVPATAPATVPTTFPAEQPSPTLSGNDPFRTSPPDNTVIMTPP